MLRRIKEYRGEVTAINQADKTITIKTPICDSICHYDKFDSDDWDILVNSLRFYDENDWKRQKHLVYVREVQVIDGYQIGSFKVDYVEALSPEDPFYWIQGAEQLDNELNEKGEKTFDKKKLEWLWALFKQYPSDLPYPELGFHECSYSCVDIGVTDQGEGSQYYLGIVVVDLDTHEADIVISPRDDDSEEEDRNFTLNLDKQEDIGKLWNLIRQAKDGVLF